MSFLVYLGGGALAGALVRWWRPWPSWAWIAGYWLAAGAFFAAPLTTSALQVPTDIAYGERPWQEMVEGPVSPANGLLSDVPLQMIPFRALVRDRLLRAEAPLWAGELGTGQPLLANAQSAPFSPLALLTLPLPPVRSVAVAAALKLFLSLLLTDALLATLGAGRAGAAFAAVAFSFSVFSICWAFHPHGMAMAWLPGILLGLVLLRRGERGGLAGLTVCAAGMVLSGHPETLAHTALGAGLVAAALLTGRGEARAATGSLGVRRGRLRYLGGLAAAALLSAGLAAPAWLPFVEALPEGARAQMAKRSTQGLQPPPFAPANLVVAIDPLAFGSPRDGNWNGPANYNELCSGYAGLLALALAVAAALALRGRALLVLAGGAAALAVAFGVPPFLDLLRALAPFDHAANARLRLFWVLAVAVAGGLGLEPLAASRRGRWIAGTCAAAAAAGVALVPLPQASWQRAWWLAAGCGSAVTAGAFLWMAARPSRRAGGPVALGPTEARWLPWLAVACLALDLGLLNWRFLPVIPDRFDLSPPPAVAVLTAAMRSEPASPFRVIGSGDALLPNLAALYGLWDPRVDDPMQPARATLVVGRAFRPRYRLGQPMRIVRRPFPVPFLSYLGVRFILTRHREELYPPWQEAWDGQGGKLWRNPQALPLFFAPAAWRQARDADDAMASTLANEDFAAAAVVEAGPSAGALSSFNSRATKPASSPAGGAPASRLRLRRAGDNDFELAAAGPAADPGGLVASSVTFDRGWRLAIDGRPARLLRVNAAFLGFFAPPGWQRARLVYRPAGWVWGVRWCAMTVAAVLAVAAVRILRRRRQQATGHAREKRARRASSNLRVNRSYGGGADDPTSLARHHLGGRPGRRLRLLCQQARLRGAHRRVDGRRLSLADGRTQEPARIRDRADEDRAGPAPLAAGRRLPARAGARRRPGRRSLRHRRLPRHLRRAEGERGRVLVAANRAVLRHRGDVPRRGRQLVQPDGTAWRRTGSGI
jgi:hypothetical protein